MSKNKNAWICSFYSFKGGLGRTLACANIARHLAEDRGYRVGLVDMDLEAPGLSQEPLCSALERPLGDFGKTLRDEVIDKSDGFILGFADAFKYQENWEASRTLQKAVVPLPLEGYGSLFFMPSGPNTLTLDRYGHRWDFVAAIAKSNSKVPEATNRLFRAFIDEFNLDYLLIDCRTGYGEFFETTAISIPNCLFLFLGFTHQNLPGLERVYKYTLAQPNDQSIKKSGSIHREAPSFLSLTPIPSGGSEKLEHAILRTNEHLQRLRKDREQLVKSAKSTPRFAFNIPRSVDFWHYYTSTAAFEETYFIGNYPHSLAAHEYKRMADTIERLIQVPVPADETSTGQSLKHGDDKDTTIAIAADQHQQPHIETFFKSVEFELKNQKRTKNERKTKSQLAADGERCYRNGKLTLNVFYFDSDSTDSPWANPERLDDYDLVMAPYRSLPAISDHLCTYRQIRTINKLKECHFAMVDLRKIDAIFPGWKNWCSYQNFIYGLPFIFSTPLFYDWNYFIHGLCEDYWTSKYETDAGQAVHELIFGSEGDSESVEYKEKYERFSFLPSNWEVLLELISLGYESGLKEKIGYSTTPQAIHREWNAIVSQFGGGVIDIYDARINGDFQLEHSGTVLGTEIYYKWRMCCELYKAGKTSKRSNKKISPTDNVLEFCRRKIGLNLGTSADLTFSENEPDDEWSQICKRYENQELFEYTENGESPGHPSIELPLLNVSVASTNKPNTKHGEPSDAFNEDSSNRVRVNVSRLPRDIRYNPATVIYGSMFVIPKKYAKSNQDSTNAPCKKLEAVSQLLNDFLDVNRQEQLVKRGFPSPCLPIIKKQIVAATEIRRKLVRKKNLLSQKRVENEKQQNGQDGEIRLHIARVNDQNWAWISYLTFLRAQEDAIKFGKLSVPDYKHRETKQTEDKSRPAVFIGEKIEELYYEWKKKIRADDRAVAEIVKLDTTKIIEEELNRIQQALSKSYDIS